MSVGEAAPVVAEVPELHRDLEIAYFDLSEANLDKQRA